MIQRFLRNRVHTKATGTVIGRQHNLILVVFQYGKTMNSGGAGLIQEDISKKILACEGLLRPVGGVH